MVVRKITALFPQAFEPSTIPEREGIVVQTLVPVGKSQFMPSAFP